ncbi:MAG: hypothetical protein KME49_32205 [Brasilonema octagenarum HA4186-MV1]|jgi:hypothetical protein|uniref:Uncharacterized protein n=2 Tax=Brasilonema TaxID=383614 RepID=A0A856MKH8_9CYAN|nr:MULTISPECIES: hypothetical protein [Brasilonema]MBW4630049.1 hypothetical protein [Brasilonema octagenarum HA4186-MV1]NMF65851.1 hypothetical protein [Brasilonema octagenarum UFV-OR1]QDL10650.1 hypothetical protein DP114_24575 [Brasilonema sennae CENA114]QDL16997.1 hypothetical protein DP113_24490 [Brasilonema octagenarum UFV-E1]
MEDISKDKIAIIICSVSGIEEAIALLCLEGFFQNPSPQIGDLGQANGVWLGHRAHALGARPQIYQIRSITCCKLTI